MEHDANLLVQVSGFRFQVPGFRFHLA